MALYGFTDKIVAGEEILAFNNELPYDSLYIYVIQNVKFVPEVLYKELSQNGRITI